MEKKKETMFVLVCHTTEEWSSAEVYTTLEKAQSAMAESYMAEYRDAIASGYDEEEMADTSNISNTTAVVGWGCLSSPYIFAIHEVEVK